MNETNNPSNENEHMSENRNDIKETNPTDRNRWKPGKPKLSRFITCVGSGVAGSVLTLAAVTYTPFLDTGMASVPKKNAVTEQKEAAETYTVQQTSAAAPSLADMVENASKAIVGIVNYRSQGGPFGNGSGSVESGSGSGVIFKKKGNEAFIVTNNHVIEGAAKVEIALENGGKTKAELVGADALSDLAVLKIDAKYAAQVLEFGDSDSLRAGDQVVAIGNPLGLDFSRTVTQGIVSAVDRSVSVATSAGKWDLNVIQTDAAINPGNSGGALLNTEGKVIGINSLKISENGVEGLGFAIPSNDAVPLLEQMMETGQVERPYLGVNLADLEQIPRNYAAALPSGQEKGVMITGLDPNAPAAKAGLKVQDVIVSLNGKEVGNAAELRGILYSELKAGDKAVIKVYRGSEQKTVELTLASSREANVH